jgi:hypothetical protein
MLALQPIHLMCKFIGRRDCVVLQVWGRPRHGVTPLFSEMNQGHISRFDPIQISLNAMPEIIGNDRASKHEDR